MARQAARELVLFDFDGTIVHLATDYPRLRADLERLAAEAGIETDGRTIYELSLLLAGDERADRAVAEAERMGLQQGRELAAGVALYRRYAASGAELAVVTHNSREVVEQFFGSRDLPAPTEILDRRALGAVKAESDAVADYAHGASSIVVVGDSHFDRELARRLGAVFVGVEEAA